MRSKKVENTTLRLKKAGFVTLKNQRAMVLGWIMLTLVVVFLLIMLTQKYVSFHRNTSYQIMERAAAKIICESSLNQTITYVSTKQDNDLVRHLTENPLNTKDEYKLYETLPPSIQEYCDLYRNAAIDVTYRLLEIYPLFEVENRHIRINSSVTPFMSEGKEIAGRIRITVKVRFDKFEQSNSVVKNFKVIERRPSVLSKFTLFVDQPESESHKINIVHSDDDNMQLNGDVYPLIITNGSSVKFVENSTVHELCSQFDPAFLDRQGWIYYGSKDESVFDLTYGNAVEWGENFHRRLLNYPVDNTTPVILKQEILNTPASPVPNKLEIQTGFSLVENRFGFCKYFFFINMADSIPVPPNYLAGLVDDRPKSNIIHLMGSPASVSPTLVFGNVHNRVIKCSGIETSYNLCIGNNPPVQEFDKKIILNYYNDVIRNTWEYARDDNVRLLLQLFDIDSSPLDQVKGNYSKTMSNIEKNPYNSSISWIVSNREKGPVNLVEQDPLYPNRNVTLTVGRMAVNGSSPDLNGTILPEDVVSIRDSSDAELFNGKLEDSLKYLGEILKKKAVYRIDSYDVFRTHFLSGEVVSLPGIVHITTQDKISFPPLVIRKGGIILTDGDIVLSHRVSKSADAQDEFLVFASLQGNITVNTPQKVEASLVAPEGIVFLNKSHPVKIHGSIMTKYFPIPNYIDSKFPKYLDYDTALDPTLGKTELGKKYSAYKYTLVLSDEEIRGQY